MTSAATAPTMAATTTTTTSPTGRSAHHQHHGSSSSSSHALAHARTHSASSQSLHSSASPQSPELFTSDEARFMTESLTSAESFDPFTVGAPGFKVPALLPSSFNASAPSHPNGHHVGGASIATNRSGSTGNAPSSASLPPFAFPYSQRSQLHSASSSSHQNGMTIAAGNSLNTSSELANYGIASHPLPHARSSLFDPGWLSTAQGRAAASVMPDVDMPFAPSSAASSNNALFGPKSTEGARMDTFVPGSATADANALLMRAQGIMGSVYGMGASHHARSESAPHQSPTGQQAFSSVAFSGYGRDKQWQMEQLNYLQRAEQSRLAGTGEPSGHVAGRLQSGDASTSDVEMSRHDSGSGGGSGAMSLSNSIGDLGNGVAAPRKTLRHAASTNDLGMLGLSFPSSHNLPNPDGSVSSSSTSLSGSSLIEPRPGVQRAMTTAIGSGAAAAAYASISAPPSKTSFPETVKPRAVPATVARSKSVTKASAKSSRASSSVPDAASASASTSAAPPTSFGAAWLAHTKSLSSSSRGFKKPYLQVDLEKAKDSWRVPKTFEAPFFDTAEKQPHLVGLVERRDSRSSSSPSATRKGKGSADAASPENAAGAAASPDSAATPAPAPLLTDAQKKANHIASEQKRRANIRKGYEMLCEAVPSLREAVRREDARKAGGLRGTEGEAGEDDTEEQMDERGAAGGPRKRAAPDDADGKEVAGGADGASAGATAASAKGAWAATPKGAGPPLAKKKKDASGGVALKCEIAGERIDGRAGPRSEGIVLMKTVDYIRLLLDEHRDLLSRRNKSRLEAAKVWGIEDMGLASNSTLVDSDLEREQEQSGGAAEGKGNQNDGDAMEH